MVIITQDMIKQIQNLMEASEEPLKIAFENLHQGNPTETVMQFLKARNGNVSKAHEMLIQCLIGGLKMGSTKYYQYLQKPIIPAELYQSVRDSRLIGMSGYTKDGRPVLAIGVGLSTYDKASPSAKKKFGRQIRTCVKVLDMTGLKLSHLNHIKIYLLLMLIISPYVFSACWQCVKPLLQERTTTKVQVLSGCGRDELLKIMDYESLPHFVRRQGSGSSRSTKKSTGDDDCRFAFDHGFHNSYITTLTNKLQGQNRRPWSNKGHFMWISLNPGHENVK